MENDFVDLIMSDASASDISDSIKSMLYNKSVEKIEQIRPYVASSMFGNQSQEE